MKVGSLVPVPSFLLLLISGDQIWPKFGIWESFSILFLSCSQLGCDDKITPDYCPTTTTTTPGSSDPTHTSPWKHQKSLDFFDQGCSPRLHVLISCSPRISYPQVHEIFNFNLPKPCFTTEAPSWRENKEEGRKEKRRGKNDLGSCI